MKKIKVIVGILLIFILGAGILGGLGYATGGFKDWNFTKVTDWWKSSNNQNNEISERLEVTALKEQLGDWSLTIGSGPDTWIIDNNTREITVADIYDKGKGYDFSGLDFSHPQDYGDLLKFNTSVNVVYLELNFIPRKELITNSGVQFPLLSVSTNDKGNFVYSFSGSAKMYQNPLLTVQESIPSGDYKVLGMYQIMVGFAPDGVNVYEPTDNLKFSLSNIVSYILPLTVEQTN